MIDIDNGRMIAARTAQESWGVKKGRGVGIIEPLVLSIQRIQDNLECFQKWD